MFIRPKPEAPARPPKEDPPQETRRKRPTWRPRVGWHQYNTHRQLDQSIILTHFVALVDALRDNDVWAHYKTGRRGTCPRLVLKILAVRFLFRVSSARALGLADILRRPLNIPRDEQLPSDGTLDYRLRSGAFNHLLDKLLTLSVENAVDPKTALDSTGLAEPRTERRAWSAHGKKHPKGWRKVHISAGTTSHRIYAITTTSGDAGDAPQAPELLRQTRRRSAHANKVVGDTAYASRTILSEAEALGLQPTMKLRGDATLKALGHAAWPRMVRRARDDPEAYAREYHARSNIESTNWMLKHRFGDELSTRTPVAQDHEARLKCILHNLGCARQ